MTVLLARVPSTRDSSTPLGGATVVSIEHALAAPVGSIPAVLAPVSMDGVPARMDPTRTLGQHGDAVLTGLGNEGAAVEDLRREGAT